MVVIVSEDHGRDLDSPVTCLFFFLHDLDLFISTFKDRRNRIYGAKRATVVILHPVVNGSVWLKTINETNIFRFFSEFVWRYSKLLPRRIPFFFFFFFYLCHFQSSLLKSGLTSNHSQFTIKQRENSKDMQMGVGKYSFSILLPYR